MYEVSEAFSEAIRENTRRYFYRGEIRTVEGKVYEFKGNDIVKGSGSIVSQCCGMAEMEIGAVYAAELNISLFLDVDRYSLENAEVRLFFSLKLKNGTYETIPMGVYRVTEANRSVHILEIKAYDNMLLFEKKFKGFSNSGYPYDLLKLICKDCNVGLALSEEVASKLPNANIMVGLYEDNDVETYRDVLYYLAQVLGGFFYINRDGFLDLKKFGEESVFEIGQKQRYVSSVSDFVTRYTAVSSTNIVDQIAEYYGLEVDDGLTMNLETNPFLQFGYDWTREEICRNILSDVAVINYVPFDAEYIGNPALDIGDVIELTGGQCGDGVKCCITSRTIKLYGKEKIKGVGKNPYLSRAKSKHDKNISGLLNKIDTQTFGYAVYRNEKALEIGEEPIRIVDVNVVSKVDTIAEFIGEIQLEVVPEKRVDSISLDLNELVKHLSILSNASLTESSNEEHCLKSEDISVESEISADEGAISLKYEVAGEVELCVTYVWNDYKVAMREPVDTFSEGKRLMHLIFPITDVKASTMNSFQVLLSAKGGKAYIKEEGVLAIVHGQGMGQAAITWDGTFKIEEFFNRKIRGGVTPIKGFKDEMKLIAEDPFNRELGEKMEKIQLLGTLLNA